MNGQPQPCQANASCAMESPPSHYSGVLLFAEPRHLISPSSRVIVNLLLLLTLFSLSTSGLAEATDKATCDTPPWLDYSHPVVKEKCTQLEMVCVDQGEFILHDEKFVKGKYGKGLPEIKVAREDFHRYVDVEKDPKNPVYGYAMGGPEEFRKLSVRLPTPAEYAHQRGKFSRCTVPIVLHQPYLNNLGEFFCRLVVMMYRLGEKGNPVYGAGIPLPMSPNHTITLGTTHNLPAQKYHYVNLQPFSNLKIATLGDLSARHGDQAASKHTYEGKHIRCFEKLHVCTFDSIQWTGMWKAAREVVKYQLGLPDAPGTSPHRQPVFKKPGKVLRVLFEKRTGSAGTRIFLNIDQLLDECNSYDWSQALQGQEWDAVECATHAFGRRAKSDISLMQDVDIFIAPHGAGLMNALYMKQNKSVIELRPHGYNWMATIHWPAIAEWNKDGVRIFFVHLEDDDLWEPGAFEALALAYLAEKEKNPNASLANPRGHAAASNEPYTESNMRSRDRNIRLKLWQLEHSIKRVLMPLYRDADSWYEQFKLRNLSWRFVNNSVVYFDAQT